MRENKLLYTVFIFADKQSNMMTQNHQNGDAVVGGDSFWDVNGYQHVIKRTESGMQMCGELSKLVLERSEIEKDYAKRLKSWAHKWRDNFDHGIIAA